MTLCKACWSINFDDARCCAGEGGSAFQAWKEIKCSSRESCELCSMIIGNHNDSNQKEPLDDTRIICNLWNYNEGDQHCFKGSHCIIFSVPESSWCVNSVSTSNEDLKIEVLRRARSQANYRKSPLSQKLI